MDRWVCVLVYVYICGWVSGQNSQLSQQLSPIVCSSGSHFIHEQSQRGPEGFSSKLNT